MALVYLFHNGETNSEALRAAFGEEWSESLAATGARVYATDSDTQIPSTISAIVQCLDMAPIDAISHIVSNDAKCSAIMVFGIESADNQECEILKQIHEKNKNLTIITQSDTFVKILTDAGF